MIPKIARTIATALGLAASLALPAGSASAAYTLPTTGAPVGVVVTSSIFTNYFNFSLASLSDVTGIGVSPRFIFDFPAPFNDVVLPPVTFGGISLFGCDNTGFTNCTTGVTIAPLTTYSADTSGFSFSKASLAAGFYQLKVSGTADIRGGGYGVSMMAAAVPEPGEWAMMLAGLGIIGVMARRRNTRI